MRSNQDLLDDVFSNDEEFRSAVLTNTLRRARRQKRGHNLARAVALVATISCAGLFAILQHGQRGAQLPSPAPQAETSELRVVPGTDIRLLSEEELLKMFPGRPVALLGEGDQKEFVVLDTLRQ